MDKKYAIFDMDGTRRTTVRTSPCRAVRSKNDRCAGSSFSNAIRCAGFAFEEGVSA